MQDIKAQSINYKQVIQAHWRMLSIGVLGGLLFGSIAYVLLPSKWESVALVQIGALASGQEIEALPIVIERLKLRSFKDAAAQRAGRPELSELLKGKSKIKLKKIRKTNVLEMKIQANTPELSKVAVESIVNQLIFQHTEIIQDHFSRVMRKETLQNIQEYMEVIEIRAKSLKGIIDNLEKEIDHMRGKKIPDSREYIYLVSSLASYRSILYSNVSLITDLKSQDQMIRHSPRLTQLIEPVNTSSRPVFPHLFFTLLTGVLIGLIFSAGFIYSRTRP